MTMRTMVVVRGELLVPVLLFIAEERGNLTSGRVVVVGGE